MSTQSAPEGFAIQTASLSRHFGSHRAVDKLDLTVPRGSIFGFLGPNGAGKSTTIRMLVGLLTPTSGTALVLGFDPAQNDLAVKRRVGYVPDVPQFYEWMTIGEILAFAARYRRPEWDERRAATLLDRFKLPEHQKLKGLSKGQRSKVSLTMALAFNPDLLVLDEPIGGLDPLARRQFVEGVLREFADDGHTVFISSHLVNEISGIVDHVAILKEGRLLRSTRLDELIESVRKVRLVFENTVPWINAGDGVLRVRSDGREAVLVIDGYSEAKHGPLLASFSPERVEVEHLTLEEIFVELVGEAGPEEGQ